MNTEIFIARKLIFSRDKRKSISRSILDVAIFGISLGLAVMIAGLILRIWASGHLKKEKELTTSGPYRYTRNPLYLGNVIIGIGVVIGSYTWWVVPIFAIYFLVFYPVIILEEKGRMQKYFPLQYSPYSKNVPLFFPGIHVSWPKSPRKFSWKLYKGNRESRTLIGALVYWATLMVLMFFFCWLYICLLLPL